MEFTLFRPLRETGCILVGEGVETRVLTCIRETYDIVE